MNSFGTNRIHLNKPRPILNNMRIPIWSHQQFKDQFGSIWTQLVHSWRIWYNLESFGKNLDHVWTKWNQFNLIRPIWLLWKYLYHSGIIRANFNQSLLILTTLRPFNTHLDPSIPI